MCCSCQNVICNGWSVGNRKWTLEVTAKHLACILTLHKVLESVSTLWAQHLQSILMWAFLYELKLLTEMTQTMRGYCYSNQIHISKLARTSKHNFLFYFIYLILWTIRALRRTLWIQEYAYLVTLHMNYNIYDPHCSSFFLSLSFFLFFVPLSFFFSFELHKIV